MLSKQIDKYLYWPYNPNIYLFKVNNEALDKGVKYVQS